MACEIITSCVLLGQAVFLQRYADNVVRSLQGLIGTVIHCLSIAATKILCSLCLSLLAAAFDELCASSDVARPCCSGCE